MRLALRKVLPDLPSGHAQAVIGLTLAALFLFSRKHLPLEPVGRVLARGWGKAPYFQPLSTLVGDMATTIGTSTNLIVVSVSRDLGGPDFAMFDFALPAAIAGGVTILAVVVSSAAFGLMPIAIAALAGVCVMLLTRCLSFESALRAISPAVFFIVAASLALGTALVETGATAYITEGFLALTAGASPMAYKTNLLVMSAGNYRFGEFVKVGVPLTILMWLTLTWVLAAIYFP
jgi:di/tricarboxylate transporter